MNVNRPSVTVVGSLNMDIVVESPRAPVKGETIQGLRAHFLPGGKGANQAIAAARLEANVRQIGCVGDDRFGEQLIDALRDNGVHTDAVRSVQEVSTGIASVLLTEGDNRIIVVSGANAMCSPDLIREFESAVADSDVILLQLEIPIETAMEATRIAKRHGKTVVLNPAPAAELPDELLRMIDVITPNRTELASLTGIPVDDKKQLEAAMRKLTTRGPKRVVATLGGAGAAYLTEGQEARFVSGLDVEVVDTTGAGDAFNAALAVRMAEGFELGDAVRFAICTSALAVTKLGAQPGMPSRNEVESLFVM